MLNLHHVTPSCAFVFYEASAYCFRGVSWCELVKDLYNYCLVLAVLMGNMFSLQSCRRVPV
jgi:hypothetical protein